MWIEYGENPRPRLMKFATNEADKWPSVGRHNKFSIVAGAGQIRNGAIERCDPSSARARSIEMRRRKDTCMLKSIHARNAFRVVAVLLVVSPIALLASYVAVFAYRTNSCGPGDHVLRSEADAIAVAKRKIVKNSHFSSNSFW